MNIVRRCVNMTELRNSLPRIKTTELPGPQAREMIKRR